MATEVRPDDRALRLGRRDRALAQMEAHDLDVLVLGRTANVRYVTGTRTLWNGRHVKLRPRLHAGALHRLHPPDEHLGRGHS